MSATNATSNYFFETNTQTNTNGQPAVLSVGNGDNQAAQINTQFSTQLSVAVFDGSNNPVQGAMVTFTAPATGASGTFADTGTAVTTATTSSTGLATASVFTANGTAGSYFVDVTVGTLTNSFSLKNTLYNPNGVPDTISVSDGGNQQTKIDTTFAKAIQVVVLDGNGNYVQNVTVTFTVVAGNTGAGGTFACPMGGCPMGTSVSADRLTTTTVTGSTGLATSAVLTANHAAGNFTVMVTAGQVSTGVSETNLAVDTTTKLTSTANPSVVGQSVTLTATVTPASGNGTPGGTVIFKDNGGVIAGCGSVTLNAAKATCTPASLSLGTHPLTVEYSGDAAFNPSTGSLSQVVNQANTTTGLTSLPNPSTTGQSVTFTATVSVSAPGAGTPTGTVTFNDNGVMVGSRTLMNGQATYSTSALSAAIHPITAVYGGDSNYTGSTSSAVNQDVRNPAPAITTISPATAVTHAADTTVTITGTGFLSTSAVHFGTDTLSTTFVSPTQLTAVIPTADLSTVGGVTVTVVNPTPGGGTSNGVTFTINPGPPASLSLNPATPQNVPVTTTISLSVTVKDLYGNVVADGTTVTFTAAVAGGATASLPNNGATTTTNGVATIIATANTVAGGPYTVTAAANGQSATFSLTNTPGPAVRFTVTGFPSPTTAGVAGSVTVTAQDQYGNTATGYTGMVAITSSDAQAVLPANATLTNGTGTFTVTLKTAGTQRITATDTTMASITGSQTGIIVNAAAASTLNVTGCPSPIVVGTPCIVTVTAKDASGNGAIAYTGTARITSSDAQAVLPANATLTNGVGTFTVTLKTVGTQSIMATDTTTASITGSQTGITVNGIAPRATADSYTLTTGTTLTVPVATGVLANDTRGNPIATISANTQPAHGALALASDGSFTYRSTAPYTGTDSFTYTISNGNGSFGTGSSTATVTLTVNAATLVQVTTTAPTGAGSGNSGTASAPVMQVGGTLSLNTTGSYNNGTTGGVNGLTYTSSNPNVASVNASGVVRILTGGTATITVTAPGGVSATITITAMSAAGTGLMPNPQPMVHASAPTAAATPLPQPAAHAPGSGASGGATPQAAGAAPAAVGVVPTAAPPLVQPMRH